jgi:LmbE family N-acetylglucosaminyl deacetylase
VVAPHADDETLGMGGTIAKLSDEGHEVVVAVVTGHGNEPHPLWPRETWEVVRAEFREACEILGVDEYLFREVPAVSVADQPVVELNRVTHEIVQEVRPDTLYLPFLNDLHKDHRELFHSFSVHWRPYLDTGKGIREVWTYETQSETHLNFPYVEQGFLPNRFVDISAQLDRKLAALRCYESQIADAPHPRSIEAIAALAEWRGAQIGCLAAEAFVLVRMLG